MFIKALKNLFRRRITEKGFYVEPPPEAEGRVEYDKSKCTKCHLCVKYCPAIAISVLPGKFISVDNEKCIRCSLCTAVCPTKALVMKPK
jgi:formate hydrogenlyase subunit 6/NADH:ubiquinone oxidoreductase subunit I